MWSLSQPVHPHARGDDAGADTMARLLDGSPPRAWGRLPRLLLARAANRFTPTRVGTTPSGSTSTSPRPVHPHARGDDHALPSNRLTVLRFTPTRVGTTCLCGS